MKTKEIINEIENIKKFNYTLAPMEVFDVAIKSIITIEVIKKEIKDARLNQINDETEKAVNYGLNTALEIIDKYKGDKA